MRTQILKHTGFLVSLGTAAVLLGAGLIWARRAMVLHTFVAAVLTWTGYLFAHFFATGRFIDGLEGGEHTPGWRQRTIAFLGGFVLAAGVGLMGIGVHRIDTGIASVGAGIFFTGYVTIHTTVTGELL